MEYYQHGLPCDATQIGRFRRALGEAGVEELLKACIDAAVAMQAIQPAELERVIVDGACQTSCRLYSRGYLGRDAVALGIEGDARDG